MHLIVLTPEQEIFSGDVKRVKVPGVEGQFTVLENHAPIVSSLGVGPIEWETADGKVHQVEIESGFIEVLRNEVALLVRGVRTAAAEQ